jgi:hypothetical protein
VNASPVVAILAVLAAAIALALETAQLGAGERRSVAEVDAA